MPPGPLSDDELVTLARSLRAEHEALTRAEQLAAVADAVWPAVPLTPDWEASEAGFDPTPARRGERLRVFCDAYGLTDDERDGLLDLVVARLTDAAEHADGDERERLLRTSWYVYELRGGWEPFLR